MIICNGIAWKLDPNNFYQGMKSVEIVDHLGLIPHFVHREDTRHPVEQLTERYGFGPLTHMSGGILTEDGVYRYPEDPDLYPLAEARVNQETVRVYPYGIVAVGPAFITRMD
jgi:hypothetical protein